MRIDNPRLKHDPERFHKRPFRSVADDGKMSKKDVLEKQNLYRQKVEEIKKAVPQLKIFDSLSVLCDENFCYGKDSQNIFYYDKGHLSVSGSKKMLEKMAVDISKK